MIISSIQYPLTQNKIVTFLHTFKYEFVDCNQNKDKYVIKLSLLPILSYITLFKLYHVYKNFTLVTLICLQKFCRQHLFVILLIQLFARSSQRRSSLLLQFVLFDILKNNLHLLPLTQLCSMQVFV